MRRNWPGSTSASGSWNKACSRPAKNRFRPPACPRAGKAGIPVAVRRRGGPLTGPSVLSRTIRRALIDKPACDDYRAASEKMFLRKNTSCNPIQYRCSPNKEEVPMKYTSIALAALAVFATAAHAATPMMSAEWTAQACDAYKKDQVLSGGQVEKWIKNDAGRVYKFIHLYRTDCGEASLSDLMFFPKFGKAFCVF